MSLLMLGAFQKDKSAIEGVVAARLVSRLAFVALGLTLLLAATLSPRIATETFGGMFRIDQFTLFFKILVLIASAASLLLAQDYMEQQRTARFEYAVLVLLATLGMMMMVSANDLIALYIGLEMQSLALYVVAAFQRNDVRSSEAGLKYFVLGAMASGMLLYGSSLIYGFSGTTDFVALAQLFAGLHGEAPPVGVVVGLVFVLAGLAFKVSAVPFHMWTPDVYEGAPTPVTAFFSVAPKMAAVALLLRVMIEPFGDLVAHWRAIVMIISIGSMVLGAFAAIGQTNIKRLMAYSSIGHIGYALIGLVVGNESGIRGVLIYMAIYLFMNLGVFACILAMRRREAMVVGIQDLAGLSKTSPGTALALAVFMFSMAGIPPLAGFFGKLYIFLAAVDAKLYTLAVIGVLSSVVAAYYYIRIVKLMYFDPPADPLDRQVPRDIRLVMVTAGVLVLFFFAFAQPILSGASIAAAALFAS
jgi:NADH-quinone oxidoreductase subunit N